MKLQAYGICFFLMMAVSLLAQGDPDMCLSGFDRMDLGEACFTLMGETEISIEARGACDRNEDEMLAYAWILDLNARKAVWRMTVENSRRQGRKPNRTLEEHITLPEGDYALYFTVAPGGMSYGYDSFSDFLNDLFGGFKRSEWKRDAETWGVKLWAGGHGRLEKRDEPPAEKGIALTYMGDDEYQAVGFKLENEARLRIYALGEGDRDGMNDYGWIMDAETGEIVWKMEFRKTRWAGGADKNRVADEEIILEPGNYQVYYVSDGSHSCDAWNRLPPFDPANWGISVTPVEKGMTADDVFSPFNPESRRNMIADLTRMGNNAYEVVSFRLSGCAELFIRCLGEYGYDDRFVDYGWITDEATRETVWEMTRRNTEHAGGAAKNRMANETIKLGPGTYEVGYISDDSHACRRWNDGPPFNPDAWGIAVWGAGDDFNQELVSKYQEDEDPDVLARLVRVGDREHLRQSFTLEQDENVRIYALGEMDEDDAYDYGWIENENGRRIWQMTYDETEPAGGASKNRKINTVVPLKAGVYTVHYRSDGSHSFDHWNSDPPQDAAYWGIMLRIERD